MTNNEEKDKKVLGKKGFRIDPIIRGKPPKEPKRKDSNKEKADFEKTDYY